VSPSYCKRVPRSALSICCTDLRQFISHFKKRLARSKLGPIPCSLSRAVRTGRALIFDSRTAAFTIRYTFPSIANSCNKRPATHIALASPTSISFSPREVLALTIASSTAYDPLTKRPLNSVVISFQRIKFFTVGLVADDRRMNTRQEANFRLADTGRHVGKANRGRGKVRS
jgi:hypothetical protein